MVNNSSNIRYTVDDWNGGVGEDGSLPTFHRIYVTWIVEAGEEDVGGLFFDERPIFKPKFVTYWQISTAKRYQLL